jgi:hypothetical protein
MTPDAFSERAMILQSYFCPRQSSLPSSRIGKAPGERTLELFCFDGETDVGISLGQLCQDRNPDPDLSVAIVCKGVRIEKVVRHRCCFLTGASGCKLLYGLASSNQSLRSGVSSENHAFKDVGQILCPFLEPVLRTLTPGLR